MKNTLQKATSGKTRFCLPALVGFMATLLSSQSVQAATGSWTALTGDFLWGNSTNWNGASFPNGAGQSANFSANVTGTLITTTLDGNYTIGSMSKNTLSSSNWTITSASNVLTFDNGVSNSSINNNHNGVTTLTLDTDIVLNSNLVVTGNGNNNAKVTLGATVGGHTITGAKNITFNDTSSFGAGVLTVNSNVNTTGGIFNTSNASGGSVLIAGNLMSGVAGVTQSGNRSMTLSGANTYTGNTTVNFGSLIAGASSVGGVSGAFGLNSAVTIGNATATLNLNGFNTQIGSLAGGGTAGGTVSLGAATLTTGGGNTSTAYAGIITGTGGLTKIGNGTQTLSGTSTYTGVTTISGGTLSVSTLNNGGVAGNLGNASSAATSLVFDGGSLQYTGLAATSNRSFTINAGKTATIDATTDLTLSGAGAATTGALTKVGAGTLTLSGVNNYTGVTTVSVGTLSLGSAGSVNASSGITINGVGAKLLQTSSTAISPVVTLTQGTLTGSGTLNTVNVGAGTGGVISNNNGVAGAALTIGSLAFGGGATVNTFSNSTSAAIITTTLSTTGVGSVVINPSAASWLNSQNYDLISFGGGSIGGTGFTGFTLGTVSGISSRQSVALLNSGTVIQLSVNGDNPYWTGAGDGKWNLASTNNWKLITAGTNTTFIVGDVSLFNDSATGAGPLSVNIDAANVAPTSVTFDNTTKDYVLGGAFGISSGALTKTGTGNLTIGTVNTYAGGTTINAGTVTITGLGTLGTGSALTLGGGKLDLGGTSQTVGAVSVAAAAATGNTIGNGSLTGTSYAVSNDTGTAVISANLLANGAAGFTKTGNGSATLTGANTYTGVTTIGAGTLQIGNGTDNGTISSSSAINNNSALIFNVGSGNRSYANVIAGSGSLTQNSAGGTLTISGVNTFTGAVNVTAGTLVASNASGSDLNTASGINLNGGTLQFLANGTAKTYSGPSLTVGSNGGTLIYQNTSDPTSVNLSFTTSGFALNGNLVVQNSSSNASLTNAVSISRNITGTGNLIVQTNNNVAAPETMNPGRVVLSGDNRGWLGALVVRQGTMQFGSSNASLSSGGTGNIIIGETANSFGAGVQYGISGATGIGQTINNNIIVRSGGFRVLRTSSDNSYNFNGSVTLEGDLTVNNANFFNTYQVILNGDISGVGGLNITESGTNVGNGFTRLSGNNTYTGATTISTNATLNILSATGNAIGDSSAVSLATGALLAFNSTSETIGSLASSGTDGAVSLGANTLTTGGNNQSTSFGGVISGTGGGLTKAGSGTMTLTGTNTYTGATTISAGSLALGSTGSIDSSTTINLGTAGSRGTLNLTAKSSYAFGALQTVGGYGTVNVGAGKSITINGNLAPGNSIGVATIVGDLVLANAIAVPATGAITTMELGGNGGVAGTDYDQVAVSGQITFGGTLNILSYLSYNIDQEAIYHLFTFASRTGAFDFVTVSGTGLTDSAGVWTGSGTSFRYTFDEATGDFGVSLIPEPSTYAALAGALALVGAILYRRRRS